MAKRGTVYLIHFHTPYTAVTGQKKHQCSHYIGWALNLEERMKEHRGGYGARLIEVIQEAGITWEVVRTWKGGRDLERKLKKQKKAHCLCPVCRAAAEQKRIAEKSQLVLL